MGEWYEVEVEFEGGVWQRPHDWTLRRLDILRRKLTFAEARDGCKRLRARQYSNPRIIRVTPRGREVVDG